MDQLPTIPFPTEDCSKAHWLLRAIRQDDAGTIGAPANSALLVALGVTRPEAHAGLRSMQAIVALYAG